VGSAAHDAHSFALKWFSILSVVREHHVDGFTAEELKDLREQLGDIWYQLATLLGQANPSTTRDHYLEPFTGLQLDSMALLDEQEQAGIDALVRALAADCDCVLSGARPPEHHAEEARLGRVAGRPSLTRLGGRLNESSPSLVDFRFSSSRKQVGDPRRSTSPGCQRSQVSASGSLWPSRVRRARGRASKG
jgi:hypothetical protein